MIKNKVFQFLIRLNLFFYVGLFLSLSYLFSLLTLLFPSSANQNDASDLLKTPFEKILFGVYVIPLFETLVFQTLIISGVCLLLKRPRYNFYISIILSAVAFSLNHSYNYYYMLYTFFIGIILAFAYYIARYRRTSATLTIFMIHAIWNLFLFLDEMLKSN